MRSYQPIFKFIWYMVFGLKLSLFFLFGLNFSLTASSLDFRCCHKKRREKRSEVGRKWDMKGETEKYVKIRIFFRKILIFLRMEMRILIVRKMGWKKWGNCRKNFNLKKVHLCSVNPNTKKNQFPLVYNSSLGFIWSILFSYLIDSLISFSVDLWFRLALCWHQRSIFAISFYCFDDLVSLGAYSFSVHAIRKEWLDISFPAWFRRMVPKALCACQLAHLALSHLIGLQNNKRFMLWSEVFFAWC